MVAHDLLSMFALQLPYRDSLLLDNIMLADPQNLC